jgi:hypothetical protein
MREFDMTMSTSTVVSTGPRASLVRVVTDIEPTSSMALARVGTSVTAVSRPVGKWAWCRGTAVEAELVFRVAVGVAAAFGLAVGVRDGVAFAVRVGDALGFGVRDGDGVGFAVRVGDVVGFGVRDGDGVGFAVRVGVVDAVGLGVRVGVGFGVSVRVAVRIAVSGVDAWADAAASTTVPVEVRATTRAAVRARTTRAARTVSSCDVGDGGQRHRGRARTQPVRSGSDLSRSRWSCLVSRPAGSGNSGRTRARGRTPA